MARQKGLIKIEGTLGDVTFYKSQDGHLAKGKTTLKGDRVLTDATFENTRKNMAEFSRGGKAAKLFREAFRTQLQQVGDNRVNSRLVKRMMDVLHSDFTPGRGAGKRLVEDGNFLLLQDFNCNIHSQLSVSLHAIFSANFDRSTGNAQIILPALTPAQAVTPPAGTTHFKIFTAASEIDFVAGKFNTVATETPMILWDNLPQPALTLANALTPAGTVPVFMLLGIQFYKVVNGVADSLNDESSEAMSVVFVDMP